MVVGLYSSLNVQEAVPAVVAVESASAPVQEKETKVAPVQETKFAPTEVVSGSGPVQRLAVAPGFQVIFVLTSF